MTETLTTLPTMERVLFLRRVPLFADLPAGPAADRGDRVEHSFADADTIAEQGDPGDEMHIIVNGYVMVPPGSRRTPAGARRPLGRRCDRRDGRRDGRREDGVARREG